MSSPKESRLTAARLRELFDFDPATGQFARRVATCNSVKSQVGVWQSGSLTAEGYCSFRVDGTPFLAHRLAWLHVTGEWPAGLIDHKNGIRSDNRMDNLRVASRAANQMNLSPLNGASRSGLRGAHWNAALGKFQSQVEIGGERIYLGLFDTAEEAHSAYQQARLDRGVAQLR